MEIPTVKIAIPGSRLGYAIINETDFDPKTMELYKDPEEKVQSSYVAKRRATRKTSDINEIED